jgi:hypothetical protein
MRICSYLVSLCLLLSPLPVAAQQLETRNDAPRLIISDQAIADALATKEQPSSSSKRDSVKNGTIIGAVIGAAVMGGFVTFLCHALKEPGDPPCWKSSGLAIAIGAGAGALGGAGVDALLVRGQPRFFPVQQPPKRLSVGLP